MALSLQLGLRWWEYPLHRSLLQCRSSSWSCCTPEHERESSASAAAEWAKRGRDIRVIFWDLSHSDLSLLRFVPSLLEENRSRSRSSSSPGPGLVCSSSRQWKTPKRGRLSWHELTYQTDMETKPFLSLGKFVCSMTKPCSVIRVRGFDRTFIGRLVWNVSTRCFWVCPFFSLLTVRAMG